MVMFVAGLHVASAFGNTVDGGDGGTLYPTIVSLLLILSAAVAATVFLKRWKGSIGRSAGPLKLRHIIALGPRERLALVQVGSRFLVVGVTPAGITAVADMDDLTLDLPETAEPAGPTERDPAPAPVQPGNSSGYY
jgi:flagellar protein FliO/FliZ